MSYLETVNNKRAVNKDDLHHQELVKAVTDLQQSLLRYVPSFKVEPDSKDYSEHFKGLATLMSAIKDTITKIEPADTSDLLSAIKKLKLDPVINVPEPKVTVTTEPVDFTPLQDTIREVMQHEEKEEVIDRFDLSRYKAVDLKDGRDKQYVGFVNPEGNWYIVENDIQQNRMRYLFGDKSYSKHFKNAAQYDYKLLDKAIHATT